ncbi:MAG: DUF3500 domain-containing protein [Verrucomicrobiota bacterium]
MKAILSLLLLAMPVLADDIPAPLAMKTAANEFLASLEEAKLKKARLPFDGDERENWHYVPKERTGLSLKEMNESQKNAAVALVASAMSEAGAVKAAQIITLEAVLAGIENDPEGRDQELYWAAVFGEPGNPKGWGFRIEGHHLSINITIVGGEQVSVTPSFMGTNPAEVAEGDAKGMRPLGAEEDLGRTLAAALLESGKKSVVFSEEPPREILTGADRTAKQLDPVGLTAADMSDAQRKALFELIAEYTNRYRDDLAAADLARIRKIDHKVLRFGWAGSVEAGEPYYYRIQGPSFLIEAANTQNNANHMHTVWRDLKRDFGRDLLKEHVEKAH